MDQRLIVTMSYVVHVAAGAVLAVAYVATDATFTDGQDTFLLSVGYVEPTVALGSIRARNYVLGAPLCVSTLATTGWFTRYFLFVDENPARAFAVGGDAGAAYALGAVAVVTFSFVAALLGS